jgi:hypothetical protein
MSNPRIVAGLLVAACAIAALMALGAPAVLAYTQLGVGRTPARPNEGGMNHE